MTVLKRAWRYFTGDGLGSELLRFAYVGVQGTALMGLVMWLFIDVAKAEVVFDIALPFETNGCMWMRLVRVDTWKFAFALSAIAGFFHNFFLNKLFGGLKKIDRR